jgi:hypothetical protein
MEKNQILAFLIAIAVSFLVLFWLSYRQESQLREFRIRQSKMELRILALEQEKHFGNAELHPNLVRSAPSKKQGRQRANTPEPVLEKKEITDDMKQEIEFIEKELETMGRILEEEPINVSVVKLVNKHVDNTYIDIDKLTNVVDEEDEEDDSDNGDHHVGGSDNESESEQTVLDNDTDRDVDDENDNKDGNDATSTRNENTESTIDDNDNDNEDEDICSSEMEIIIQSTKNQLGDSDTHSSHVIVDETESQLHSQKTESKLSHIENEMEAWMNNYKVNELKDICRNNGLPQTGLKRELIDRLIQKGVSLSHNP